MAKTQAKTIETKNSVKDFIKSVPEEARQKDCSDIVKLMEEQSGFDAKMWGSAIIGFGSYHYVYDSGREGDAPLVAFSARKNEFALYIAAFEGRDEILKSFGKFKASKGCIYIKKLEDVDTNILKKLITESIRHYRSKYK